MYNKQRVHGVSRGAGSMWAASRGRLLNRGGPRGSSFGWPAFDLTLGVSSVSESALRQSLDTAALDDLADGGAEGVEEHRLAGGSTVSATVPSWSVKFTSAF